jgi:DNA-binding cell septation regulator SpoVG
MSNVTPPPSGDQFISVRQIRQSPKPGAVKGYADIQYHGVTIKGVSIVQHNGGYFIGLPSNVGKNGKRFPIVEVSEPERSQIEKLLLNTAKEAGLI